MSLKDAQLAITKIQETLTTQVERVQNLRRDCDRVEEKVDRLAAAVGELERRRASVDTELAELRKLPEAVKALSDRIGDLAREHSNLRTAFDELKKTHDANRVSRPMVVGWIVSGVGIAAALGLGIANLTKH